MLYHKENNVNSLPAVHCAAKRVTKQWFALVPRQDEAVLWPNGPIKYTSQSRP